MPTKIRMMAVALTGHVVLLLAGCTQKDPTYCNETTPCPTGYRCNIAIRTCQIQSDAKVDAPSSLVEARLFVEVGNNDQSQKREQSIKPDLKKAGDLPLSIPGTWVTAKAASFAMGSPSSEPCRAPNETQHQVTLTHSYEIQTTEVTQQQFSAMSGYLPAGLKCPSCPVQIVNWHESAAYCNALSSAKGAAKCYDCTGSGPSVLCTDSAAYSGSKIYSCPGYRLPTEAEWELAYRAGSTTALYNGPINNCLSTDVNASAIGWYNANSGSDAKAVAGKSPNSWGLYDMAGNVSEWCHDWLLADLGTASATDPWGPATGTYRVTKGGTFLGNAGFLRAASRSPFQAAPSYRDGTTGFRCVRSLP